MVACPVVTHTIDEVGVVTPAFLVLGFLPGIEVNIFPYVIIGALDP